MDDTLRLIQHLYGEDVDDQTFVGRVAEDESLRREYEALQDTKAALDRRASPSPDPGVVDAVVDRAAAAAPSPEGGQEAPAPAPDRAPRAPEHRVSRRLRGVTGVLAVLLVAGVGWWQFQDSASPSSGRTAGADPTPQAVTASPSSQDRTADSVPEWDDRDEVVRLHRRIEMLRTRSRPDAWDSALQTIDRP